MGTRSAGKQKFMSKEAFSALTTAEFQRSGLPSILFLGSVENDHDVLLQLIEAVVHQSNDPTSSMCKEAACYERGWEHRPDTPQAQAAVKQLIEKYN